MTKEKIKTAPVKSGIQQDKTSFTFSKENYKLMLIGIATVFLGMILMIGGGSDDPKVFSEDIFNFQRITLAPIVIFVGYIIVLFSIIKKPKG
ncbi:MAG: DUF3098 domain-containing protein [Bacteroidota bacterium]